MEYKRLGHQGGGGLVFNSNYTTSRLGRVIVTIYSCDSRILLVLECVFLGLLIELALSVATLLA